VNLQAFAARLEGMGITFDLAPECKEAINMCIAFITGPKGTYFELTQGVANIKEPVPR
jgi:hypothetical protein